MRDRETLSLFQVWREGDDGTDITELASIGSRRRERFNFRASRKPKNDLAVFALNRIENDLKIGSSPSYTVIAASF